MLFSSVFASNERRDMGMYEMPLSMFLPGFGMGARLASFHMYCIMLVLSVGLVWVEVLCWIDHVWSSKECACCVPVYI